ncbi:MAG: RNA polymerase sigma factor SigJ [Acidimicrobiia bacterium]|nr:RNA polymerase sigma factor SigJ [Acidimicrobiia bacterium]
MSGLEPEVFAAERDRLFGLAYRLTGSVADADDVVQETWIRSERADGIDNPAAWLTTVASRLALDRLRSAQRRRETYVGPWLAEPILTDRDPAHLVELDESVRLGFLAVLERLGPVERAVFLLRDVFDLPYAEIAEIVERNEAAVRQTAHRARSRVRAERPRFDPAGPREHQLLEAFLVAAASGSVEDLQKLLAEDVVLLSDGGPRHRAARQPVVGPSRLARFLVNLTKRLRAGSTVEIVEANGEPAVVVRTGDTPVLLLEVEFDGPLVRRIHSVVNPDKLASVATALGAVPGGPGSGPAPA